MDEYSYQHLEAYLQKQFPDHWEQFLSEAVEFLEDTHRNEQDYWINLGWPALSRQLDFYGKSVSR